MTNRTLYILFLVCLIGCTTAPRELGQGNHAATGFVISSDGRMLVLGADTFSLSAPIRRLAVTSATHVGMLSQLGATDCIRAVANPDLIFRVIVNSEWQESTPLGRAEWIRAVGAPVRTYTELERMTSIHGLKPIVGVMPIIGCGV